MLNPVCYLTRPPPPSTRVCQVSGCNCKCRQLDDAVSINEDLFDAVYADSDSDSVHSDDAIVAAEGIARPTHASSDALKFNDAHGEGVGRRQLATDGKGARNRKPGAGSGKEGGQKMPTNPRSKLAMVDGSEADGDDGDGVAAGPGTRLAVQEKAGFSQEAASWGFFY